jgi:hypothetical protein
MIAESSSTEANRYTRLSVDNVLDGPIEGRRHDGVDVAVLLVSKPSVYLHVARHQFELTRPSL